MEKTKYNNGRVQEIKEIPQEEMSLAISEWSEGNQKLQEAINSCIENGIPTIASCAGHSPYYSPYLAMEINKENSGKIINLINTFTNKKNTSLDISFMERGSILTIYGNRFNKNKCFETIAREAQNSLDLESANDLTRTLWDTYVSLATHRYSLNKKLYNSMEYKNGITGKRLTISPFRDRLLEEILRDSKMKGITTYTGTVMTKSSRSKKEIIATLESVCDGLDATMYDVTDTDFPNIEDKHKNDFTEKIKTTAQKHTKNIEVSTMPLLDPKNTAECIKSIDEDDRG